MTAPWITYRPELKVLDCTIRDGGLVNDHQFEDGFVGRVPNLRRGRHRLHGGRLQGVEEVLRPRQVRRLEVSATRTTSGGSSTTTPHR